MNKMEKGGREMGRERGGKTAWLDCREKISIFYSYLENCRQFKWLGLDEILCHLYTNIGIYCNLQTRESLNSKLNKGFIKTVCPVHPSKEKAFNACQAPCWLLCLLFLVWVSQHSPTGSSCAPAGVQMPGDGWRASTEGEQAGLKSHLLYLLTSGGWELAWLWLVLVFLLVK